MCLGADSVSKSEYQNIPEDKGGRCVRLTTYHLHMPSIKKSAGLNIPEPCGPVQACNGTAFTIMLCYIKIHLVFGLLLSCMV